MYKESTCPDKINNTITDVFLEFNNLIKNEFARVLIINYMEVINATNTCLKDVTHKRGKN